MRHINIYFCSWISFVFNKEQHVTISFCPQHRKSKQQTSCQNSILLIDYVALYKFVLNNIESFSSLQSAEDEMELEFLDC